MVVRERRAVATTPDSTSLSQASSSGCDIECLQTGPSGLTHMLSSLASTSRPSPEVWSNADLPKLGFVPGKDGSGIGDFGA